MHHQLQFEAALRKWDALTKMASPKAALTPPTTSRQTASSSTTASSVIDMVQADSRLVIPAWNPPPNTESLDHGAGQDCATAVLEQVHLCLGQSLAASTMSSYQAVLSKAVAEAEAALNIKFLPLASEDDCMKLFGHVKMNDGSALHWSKVRTLKAAICQWHARHALTCPFDNWSPRLRAFWAGLAKLCVHTGPGKEPVLFEAIVSYLQTHVSSSSTDVACRNAAMVVVAFFGVRRGAEVVAFTLADVRRTSDECVQLQVRCQKNDPRGIGQVCVLPSIPALGHTSPHLVLQAWLDRRLKLSVQFDMSQHIFVTLTGKNRGQAVSTDSLRKHVTKEFGKGSASHSLRKGGAQFYARRGAKEDATRQQGGWKTSEVMSRIYTTLSQSEVRQEIISVGAATSFQHELSKQFMRLGDSQDKLCAASPKDLVAPLNFVASNIEKLNTQALLDAQVGKYLKWLTRHNNEHIRARSTHLYTLVHSRWMSMRAAKRQRQS